MTLPAILQNVPALAAGAFAAAAWAAVFLGFRSAAKVKHAADRTHRDADFVAWAAWTTVAVIDADGTVFHRSLLALQDETADLIWDRPSRVVIFRPGPDNPDPYGLALERHV